MRQVILVLMVMAIAGGAFAQNLGNSRDISDTTPDVILVPPVEGKTCGDCPPDGQLEGEPTLVDEYVDAWNGGCNSAPAVFQDINWGLEDTGVAELCGVSGWYLFTDPDTGGLLNFRDTDWFTATADASGSMEFTVESAYECYIFQLSVPDCGSAAVAQQAVVNCNAPMTLSIPTTPGEIIYLWVGPTVFVSPDGTTEFPYFGTLSGHVAGVVATEESSWGGVKSLYR